MQKHSLLPSLLLISLLSVSSHADEVSDACNNSLNQEPLDLKIVKEKCELAANTYIQKEYGQASWYYLLSGKFDLSIDAAKKAITENKKFYVSANAGHSYLLKGEFEKAMEQYEIYFKHISDDEMMQDDYKILFKLYPNKKETIQKGLEGWNDIYKPLSSINTLYPLYKEAKGKKLYKDAIGILEQIIELQKKYTPTSIDLGDNLMSMGIIYNNDAQYTKSIAILENVEPFYKDIHENLKSLATLYFWLGDNYQNLQNFPKALEYYQKSLAIKEKIAPNEVKTANTYYRIGQVYIETKNYEKALEYFLNSLTIEEVIHPHDTEIAATYNRIGKMYSNLNNYPKALEYYLKEISIRDKIAPNEVKTKNTCYTVGTVYEKMQGYEKALEYYQKALTISERQTLKVNLTEALYCTQIGKMYEKINNYQKAIEYYIKGAELFEIEKKYKESLYLYNQMLSIKKEQSIGENISPILAKMIVIYTKLANESLEKNDNKLAIKYLKDALLFAEILSPIVKINFTSKILSNLCSIELRIDDISSASYHCEQALANMQVLSNTNDEQYGYIFNNIAEWKLHLGQIDNAIEYYNQALKIFEYNKSIENIFKIKTNLLKAYSLTNDLQHGIEIGIELIEGINNHTYQISDNEKSTFFNNAGLYFLKINDYDMAHMLFKESLNNMKKNNFNNARTLNNIGDTYYYQKKYNDALGYYQKSLEIQKDILGEDHSDTGKVYSNFGYLYKHMSDIPNAYLYAKKSYDIFLKNRNKNFAILDNSQKEKYLKSNNDQIPLLLSTAYTYSKADTNQSKKLSKDTLNDWLNYKGSIYDSENALSMLYEQTTDPIIKETIEKLSTQKRELARLYQTLPKPEEMEQYRLKIKSTEEIISSLEKELSSKVSKFQEEMGLRSVSYRDIAKYLKPNELYIDYAKAGENYYLFTLDHNETIKFIQIDKNETLEIDIAISAFREDVNTLIDNSSLAPDRLKKLTTSSKDKLDRLYTLALTKPLGEILNHTTTLIVSPDGALRLLPFESLYNTKTGKYLLEEKNIRYIPSGKELIRLYHYNNKEKSKGVTVFSNPDFNIKSKTQESNSDNQEVITPNTNRSGIVKSLFKMRFDPLPGTKAEAENIKKLLGTTSIREYTQSDAKESNLLAIKNPKILHIATHGFFINDDSIPNPMLKSGIALSGANSSAIMGKNDGIITSLKLSGLDLKGTNLVILSACQTGEVDPKSTESVSGLNKAFIQAGANNVIMSLWPVADQETMELMSGFYLSSQKTDDYSLALKDSKLSMIKKGLHPYYWAPFIISGKGKN